jgi:ABC-2 type transport system permease protein
MLSADKWPALGDMQVLLDEAKIPFTQVEGYIGDSLVTLGSETAADTARAGGNAGSSGFNIFSYVMSGSLMLGLLFTSNIMLNDIVREKRAGTLARALCSPIGTGHVVAGKVLSVYAVTAIACLLLLVVGKFAFSMDLGDPAALAAHTAASILMCTGIMTLLFGIVRRERAADAIAPVVIIVLAMLGGSMLSFDMFGETMQRIGKFSPVYWANDGFKKIMVFGAGTSDISRNILVLAVIGLASLVPGALLLGTGFRKGG